MAKKPKLNPLTDTPKTKGDIDKYFVLEYTKAHGSPEQKAAIKAVIKENIIEKTSNFTGEKYNDVAMAKVRNKFCELFFPQLNEKPKAKSYLDMVEEL